MDAVQQTARGADRCHVITLSAANFLWSFVELERRLWGGGGCGRAAAAAAGEYWFLGSAVILSGRRIFSTFGARSIEDLYWQTCVSLRPTSAWRQIQIIKWIFFFSILGETRIGKSNLMVFFFCKLLIYSGWKGPKAIKFCDCSFFFLICLSAFLSSANPNTNVQHSIQLHWPLKKRLKWRDRLRSFEHCF